MFRSLLSACSIAILILPTIVFSTRTRCPVKAPETLLSLYKNSDAIVVARYDGNEELGTTKDEAGDFIIDSRKHFAVSSTLKGETVKLIALDEREFRSKFDERGLTETPVEETDEIGALYRRPNLKIGDTVLIFLKLIEQDNGESTLGLTDYRDAIKKLSADSLDAYQARIRELNSIFSDRNKVDNAAVVDWLVKTAQDPLTRWEGAYELQQSYEMMQIQGPYFDPVDGEQDVEIRTDEEPTDDDLIVKIKEKGTQQISPSGDTLVIATADEGASEEQPESEEVATETEAEQTPEQFDTATYARLLTDAHKEALTNALVTSASSKPEATPEKGMSEGDKALIELVSNFGDSRLAKYLLQQMQAAGGDPYVVFQLMTTTIRVLGDDEELQDISTKYGDVYYEDGDSFIGEANDDVGATDDGDVETTDVVKTDSAHANDIPAREDAELPAETLGEAEQSHRATYGEVRAELVWKFVARGAAVIADSEAKAKTKGEH